MVRHSQHQGDQETTGQSIAAIETTAVDDLDARHRQALGREPSLCSQLTGALVPTAGGLTQEHLSGEVVALGIGQAEQAMHANRALFMEQYRVGRFRHAHGGDDRLTTLPLDLRGQELLEPAGGIAHGHGLGVAGHRQAGDRCAIGLDPVFTGPPAGPPPLGHLLLELDPDQGRGGRAAAALAHRQLGEALQLSRVEIWVPLPREQEASIRLAPEPRRQAVVRPQLIEGNRRRHQLLVGRGNAGCQAVEIRQETAGAIGHAHAPDAGLRPEDLAQPGLQGRTTDLALQLRESERRRGRREGNGSGGGRRCGLESGAGNQRQTEPKADADAEPCHRQD